MQRTAWWWLAAFGLAAQACGGMVVVDPEGDTGAGGAGPGGVTSTGVGGPGSGGSGNGGPGGGVPEPVQAACPEIAAEPLVCISGTFSGIVVLSPATGATCELPVFFPEGISGPSAASIAVVGEHVLWSADGTQIHRVSMSTGAVETAFGQAVEAVTDLQGEILVKGAIWDPSTAWTMTRYASFDDILAGAPGEIFQVDDSNGRMTAGASTLYTAWHSTNQLERWSLPGFEPLPPLPLVAFDGWVDGFWAADDGPELLVLNSPPTQLFAFEAETGQLLSLTSLSSSPGPLFGLHCWRN